MICRFYLSGKATMPSLSYSILECYQMHIRHVVFLLLLCWSFFNIHAQSEAIVYYQTEDGLFGLEIGTGNSTLIASDIAETVAFSNTDRFLAYSDAEGVWISATDEWQPQNVLSDLPEESFSLQWTPDDTRLIVRLAFWPEDIDPYSQLLSYNLAQATAEPWIWGRCGQIAQNNTTGDFALICAAYEELSQPDITTIALHWGSDYVEYDEAQYTVLLNDILDTFPQPYDWGVFNGDENITLLDQNPEYQLGGGYSFWRIRSLWDHGESIEITHNQPEIELWFSVSPNRSWLAYSVFCGQPSDSCVQIVNNVTGAIEQPFEEGIRTERIYDLAWSHDDQHVVVLGENAEAQDMIYAFNIETGGTTSFQVGETTGALAVR
jgi:hypothetical protein